MATGTISLNPKPKLLRVNIAPKQKPARTTESVVNNEGIQAKNSTDSPGTSQINRIVAKIAAAHAARNNITAPENNRVELVTNDSASAPAPAKRAVRVKRLAPGRQTAAPAVTGKGTGRKTVADVLRSKPTPPRVETGINKEVPISTTLDSAGIVPAEPQLQQQQQIFHVPPENLQDFSRFAILSRNKRLQYCRICSKGFKTQELFVQHFMAEHPGVTKPEDMFEDPWRCMYCDKWFDGPRRLSFHVKSLHKDALSVKDSVIDNKPQMVECKLCGAVLRSSLIKHTLKAHATEIDALGSDVVKDPRRCALCGKMCSGEQGLRHHLYRTHGAEVAKQLDKTLISLSESLGAKRFNPNNNAGPSNADDVVAKKAKLTPSSCVTTSASSNGYTAVKNRLQPITITFADMMQQSANQREATTERDDSPLSYAGDSNLRIVEEENDDVIISSDEEEIDSHAYSSSSAAIGGLISSSSAAVGIGGSKHPSSSTAASIASRKHKTFCDDCKLDLTTPAMYARHYTLRHTPMQCPLCSVWLKGQIGLEAHDDSVHRGALRLGAVTSL